jgi:hypothetical protein
VERLPGYAPGLNPVEMLWGNLKGQEFANRCAEDLAEKETAICDGMNRVRNSAKLPFFIPETRRSFLLIILSLYYLLLTRFTTKPQRVIVIDLPAGAPCKWLDENTIEKTLSSPEEFRAQPGETFRGPELTLSPYGTVILDADPEIRRNGANGL